MKQYYIPYFPEKQKFNYLPVLYLYSVAAYSKTEKAYNRIAIQNLDELAKKINQQFGESVISKATLSRVLNDKKYSDFFTYNKEQKEIILKNDFRNKPGVKEKKKFIVLSAAQFDFLVKRKDSLLIQYYFYLRYHCGSSKTGRTDSTAKQFLAASGYSVSSGSYISRISDYNGLLSSKGFISIQKKKENGKERNIYSC